MRVFTTSEEVRQVAYVANGTRLAVGIGDLNGLRALEWRELRTGRLKGSIALPGRPRAVALAPGSRHEFVAHPDTDQIHILTENTHHMIAVPEGRRATSCALTTDGSRIAHSAWTGFREPSIISIAALNRLDETVEFRTGTLVEKMVFDPIGAYLVSIGWREYTVWDLNRHESRTAGTLDGGQAIAYSNDGSILAVAASVGASLFIADGSRMIRSLQRPGKAAVRALAFAPDNRTLFLAAGAAVHVFEVDSGILRHTHDWDVGSIHSVAVAPDGLTAAAGSNGSIVVWDLDD
jgi:WD40 repeat protein